MAEGSSLLREHFKAVFQPHEDLCALTTTHERAQNCDSLPCDLGPFTKVTMHNSVVSL